MKILITHNYFLRLDPKQWERQKPYPPLGTLYAASSLREAGHDVLFFDIQFEDGLDNYEKKVNEFNPDFVVLYEDGFNYLTKMCLTNMRDAAFKMLRIAKSNNCKTIVSGSDSTDHFKEYHDQGADIVIFGEAEATLLELVDGENDLEKIKGISYQLKDKVINNGGRAVLTDLDKLPMPAWDLLDIRPYQNAWKKHGFFSINIATTRGCPFKCNWCAKPIYGNRYNSHSPEYIVKMMLKMKALFHFDHIWFSDDIFGLKPNWVVDFEKETRNSGIRVPYQIQSRADLLVKEGTVKALADSGCDEVWIGAESGSQKVLDAMDKGTTVEQIEESTKLMKEHGIKPCFFLQLGYPGEEWEDIEMTINMLDKLKPHDIGVSVSYPLPGTKFYENVKEQLEGKANWTDSDELLMMYQGTYHSKFYKHLHRYIHRKFRSMKIYENRRNISPIQIVAFFYHKTLMYGNSLKMTYSKRLSPS